jgi:hypothetical protein
VPAAIVPKTSITISPNPFVSQVSAYLSLDKTQRVQISVTDLTGRVVHAMNGVYSQGNSEVRLSLDKVPGGVYMIKVAGENFTTTPTIVKR